MLLHEVKRKSDDGEGFLSAGFFESDIPAEIVAGKLEKIDGKQWFVVKIDKLYMTSREWDEEHEF
jgi:hypothetical protein